MTFSWELGGFFIVFIWLSALTYLYFKNQQHYNSLTQGSSGRNLQGILEELLKDIRVSKKDIDLLLTRCDRIEKDSLLYIQKVGLTRFNPFKDTGGDQSFILSLLDANNTGVVVSGLYSRSGTRWYAKKVRKGEGVEHELTDEERKAIKVAKSAE
jgi:hypothetical protein